MSLIAPLKRIWLALVGARVAIRSRVRRAISTRTRAISSRMKIGLVR
jgi:hypothetical protein